MSNYIDTFQAASVGAGLPSGWTARWNTPSWSVIDEGGDKIVQQASTIPVAAWGVSLDAADADSGRADFDIIVRVRAASMTTNSLVGCFGRGSGTDTATSTMYSCVLYASDRIRVRKTISGVVTTLQTTYHGFSAAANTFYYLRFRGNGTTLQAKVWAGVVADQPGTWLIETTDASITGAGTSGFLSVAAGMTAGFGEIAIATNGDVPTFTADTTAPVLTSPTGTAASATTASGTVTTDEGNGTLYFLATTNATETQATVIAGGATGGSQAISSTGVKTVNVTGLTPSTGYYLHYVHRDSAVNDSTRVSSSLFTTTSADVTAPTLSAPTATQTGATTASLGVTTNENNGTLYTVVTTSATPPTATQIRAGQNNSGTAAVYANSQLIVSTGAKTFSATGLTASTTYYAYFHHRDASDNDSTVAAASSITTASSGVKGARKTFFNGSVAQASLAGLSVCWWDTSTPHAFAAPLYQTNAAATDGTGTLTVNLSGVTALAIGGTGYMLVFKADGGDRENSLQWQGLVDVSDIA